MADVHVGDTGTIIRLTLTDDGVPVDISTASPLQIVFKDPQGTGAAVTAELTSGGTDGVFEYVTLVGTFSKPGNYDVQGFMTIGGTIFSTSINNINVGVKLPTS